MRFTLDLHIHSRFARACSPQLTLENIAITAQRKGVDIVGTGDFTHPEWFKSIVSELEEVKSSGLYRHKKVPAGALFILSAEVSLVYRDGDKARRIHLVIHAPNIAAVNKLNKKLGEKYNLRADGRPILGISAPEFVRLCLEIDPRFIIYPAHIWTPWYSVLGSKLGFNSLEECFKDQTINIYAYETGLSSDPPMNWRVSALDKFTRLSSSDAHGLSNIGREATVMSLAKTDYSSIYQVIKNNRLSSGDDKNGLVSTIEFFPEEGTYHFDGHRDCGYSCSPDKSKKNNGICPRCKRPLVIGVASRVDELSDRPEGYKLKNAAPYISLVGLSKIIAEALGVKNHQAITVTRIYDKMIEDLGNELYILTEADTSVLKKEYPKIAPLIARMRTGKVHLSSGYDGQYGQVHLLNKPAAVSAAKV